MRSWSLVPEDWRRGIYVEQSFGMRVRYREKRRPALQRKPTSRRRVYWAMVASTISTWAIVSSHKMLRTSLFLSRLAFVAALVGCVQNGVRPLTTGSTAKEDSTVIVYGIKIEGDWRYPRFGIQLAEYSIEKQVMPGNCFQFNKTEASIPSSQTTIGYFAFEAPPGHYVYSPFNGAQLQLDSQAFSAPKGRTVYIGDFIYIKDRVVVLRKDLDALKAVQGKSLPSLPSEISSAKSLPVQQPKPFLCTP